ncbi:hypothetical protein PybrP1_008962 [[Pythium] brassicae (nom. inval.)]|nr:hypothetical protein PybrP1_008962 [[Pythium] brassicae (nom. inval.)]
MTATAKADERPPAPQTPPPADYQLLQHNGSLTSAPAPARLPPIALPRPVDAASAARGLVRPPPRFVLVQATPGATPREAPPPSALASDPDPPRLVAVLSRAQLEAVEQLRWAAFFIFLLYVLTFFAWPSLAISAAGLATGLVGYAACRLAQQGARRHWLWVVIFLALNCVMVLLHVYVFASLFVRDLRRKATDGQPAMMLLAVFVALGLLLHVRAQRIARDFLQVFRGGVARVPRRASLTIVRPRRPYYVHDTALAA